MPKKSKSAEYPISPSLQQLREKYPDYPALKEEAIYALPLDLIMEIKKERRRLTREVREFFTDEEAQFEIDLTEASGGGFFLGQPFGYLSLSKPPVGEGDAELDERFDTAVSSIKQMLADGREADGFDREAVEAAMRPDEKADQKILERREGYAGWLVTSPAFRTQRVAFCKAVRRQVRRHGRFPPFWPSMVGEPPNIPQRQRAFFEKCMPFYQTWGLHRMLTWDLPVPMRPQWTDASGYYLPQIGSEAGLVVFVPWYLLRHKDLKIEDIVDRKRAIQSPSEIRDWLDREPKGWGTGRYATILRIYIYLELALNRRYAERIKGYQERLDYAFQRFLKRDLNDEKCTRATVEKARRHMTARLNKKT